jgi:hypothetical protein
VSWLFRMARSYVRWRIRRGFDGLYLAGEDHARDALGAGPVVVAVNHVSWWDALVIIALDARIGGRGRCLMDAQNLARMPFFGWLGAVPLDRSSPRASLRDLAASIGHLDGAGRSLWIFPQGELRPPRLRPFAIQGGVAWLVRRAGVPVVPLTLDYFYREAPSPTIAACYGAPIAKGQDIVGEIERSWDAGLARIGDFALSGDGFEPVVPPRPRAQVPALGRGLAHLGRLPRARRVACTTRS